MTSVAQALYAFWSGFDLPAYVEDNVPVEAALPYITYTLSDSGWDSPTTHQVRVWYRSTSYIDIAAKVDEIKARVGVGIVLPISSGGVTIRPGDPLVQFQPMDGTDLKVAYMNFQLNCFSMT